MSAFCLIDDEQVLVDMGQADTGEPGLQRGDQYQQLDALALFATQPHRFDLVITDMTMPNMTGDKLAWNSSEFARTSPSYFAPATATRYLDERIKTRGINTFLMKPILMAKMARTVREALGENPDTLP